MSKVDEIENMANSTKAVKSVTEKDYNIMMGNLKAAVAGVTLVKSVEGYWKSFNNPESERRIRIAPQDYFSMPMTLLVSNEIQGRTNNNLGPKIS